ncbi:MAG: hypothetical protein QF415_03605 [Candidatus Undinarchaeales archaeon]|jgi:hypothetical protein|nr:hypothetical protein [Candidatus Undinarchaeales archaeon]MDP7493693.1 hypothetical protein [Candidatus Undinarchaeales archaeon]
MAFHRLLRTISAIVLVALLLTPGSAIVADEVVEEVDISTLKYAQVDITYVLPSRYLDTLDDQLLNSRCSLLSSVTGCRASIYGGEEKVVFNMLEPSPEIGVRDIEIQEDLITVEFYFKYLPKQYVLAQGLMVRERGMKIRYPTHTTVLNYVLDMPLLSQFAISRRAVPFSATVDKTSFVIGETIPIPKISEGIFCVAALLDGDTVIVRDYSSTCSPFELGTTSFIPEGSYDLYLIALTGSSTKYNSVRIDLEASDIPTYLDLDKDRCNLGESFVVKVTSSEDLDRCEVRLIDPFGNEVEERTSYDCENIILGTSPALVPGRYLIKAYAWKGEERGAASMSITLVGQGYTSSEITTDSDVYNAGDNIEVYADTEGDLCITELFDSEYNKVGEATSVGCRPVDIAADDSLEAGNYLLKTTVKKNGRIISVAPKGIEIRPWSERRGTVQSDLCQQGKLYILGERFPCISSGEVCVPSSSSKPLCLCFDDGGNPKDFCDYGHTCGQTGCSATKVFKTPFIIIRDQGKCLARKGDQTISCIALGEICAGNCVCINEKDQPLSSCVGGDTCTFEGCRRSTIELEVTSVTPESVRSDELRTGAQVTWKGHLHMDDQLFSGSRSQLEFTMRLGTITLEDAVIEAEYVSSAEGWKVTGTFSGDLDPGRFETFLMVKRGEDIHIMRKPIQVWYPVGESNLNIEMRDINPEKMSYRELGYGGGVELTARVTDHTGRALTGKDLPPDAFNLTLEGAKSLGAFSISEPTFDQQLGLWVIKGTFMTNVRITVSKVSVIVNHLGRNGKSSSPFELLEHVPLVIRIKSTDPGSQKPIFHLMAITGFDMDVYVSIDGSVSLQAENFDITFGNIKIKPDCSTAEGDPCIDYLMDTEQGVRIHLSNIKLCPNEPPPNSSRDLKIKVKEQGQKAEDKTQLRIIENPGKYQVRCS